MSERILIVSDTHGRLNYFKEMLARTGKPDRLIHLGDSEGQQDEEGLQIMRTLGSNMAWLLKCIEAGKAAGITTPQAEDKIKTNFIR